VGHNGAGSGAIDLAAGLLAMRYNTVPPAATAELAPGCGINLVMGEAIDARVDSVLSISYALSGGQTAALVIRRLSE
jgi:3-oxoacyl-(acyl-carrier-protein) synthase